MNRQNEAVNLSKHWHKESNNAALTLFQTVSKDWLKLNNPSNAIFCLNEIAKLAQVNSDYETAFAALNQALNLSKTKVLEEQQAVSVSNFILVAVQKGDQKMAGFYSVKARSISKNSEFSPETEVLLNYVNGIYEYFYGNLKTALAFFEKAETQLLQSNDIELKAQVLNYLGYSYLRDGNLILATQKLQIALKMCEEKGSTKGVALSLSSHGFLSYFLNEKQKALDFFSKSERLFPENFEWLERARIENAIGRIYLDFGEFELAETFFLRANNYFEKARYPSGKIPTLTNLAEIYSARSDFQKARKTFQTAITLTNQIGDNFSLASIKVGLGNIEFKTRNYDSALNIYFEARRTFEEIGVDSHFIDSFIGQTFEKKNDLSSARKHFQKARVVYEKRNDNFPLSETLFLLAKLDHREGNSDSAFDLIRRSIDLAERFYSDVAGSKLKQSYLSDFFLRYEFLIRLLMEKHRLEPQKGHHLEAFRIAEKIRSRGMLENLKLSEADFKKDLDPQIIEKEKQLRNSLTIISDKITDLLSQNADSDKVDGLKNELNQITVELERINAEIKQKNPLYATISSPPSFDLVNFQNTVLDDETLFLEFFFSEKESYLWVVGKTEFDVIILPPINEIESKIISTRDLILAAIPEPDESIESFQERIKKNKDEFWRTAQSLSNILFGPISQKIVGKRLVIVPHGKLNLIPAASLPMPFSDSKKPLLLSNETVYEPSAQILSVLHNSLKKTESHAKMALVLADPVFTTEDSRFFQEKQPESDNSVAEKSNQTRFAESLTNLPRLTASKTEGESIKNIIGEKTSDFYFGFDATREKVLRNEISDYKIIHFAAHGLVYEDRPELSGIVFSGLDKNGSKIDQVLRLHDIYGLELNADTVVLSACNTGIGKEIRGEGWQSLNNAFLSVGAKSVVASLWKVEDSATLELMTHFYEGLATGEQSTSEALRNAQIKMFEKPRYESPFYWAAFTIQGDFRQKPQFSTSINFGKIFFFGGILAIISFCLLFLMKKLRLPEKS